MRRRRTERGASALELSILAPMLIGLIFMSVQTALWLYGRSVALNAAQEGVSQLRVVQPEVYTGAIGERVRRDTETYTNQLAGTALRRVKVLPVDYDTRGGEVSVTVTGHAISLVPGLDLVVKRTATGPIEEFEADK